MNIFNELKNEKNFTYASIFIQVRNASETFGRYGSKVMDLLNNLRIFLVFLFFWMSRFILFQTLDFFAMLFDRVELLMGELIFFRIIKRLFAESLINNVVKIF